MSARDWTDLALTAGGRSLIEASAGTGKTFTIAVLYLRLLLEAGLMPRQIVVTTFAEAAAQELRERIRARLQQSEALAARVAASGNTGPAQDDPAMAWLQRRWQDNGASAALDHSHLQRALAELDSAPISTLHGLCHRVLADHPFETASPFAMGELVSGDALLDECTRDLFRVLADPAQPLEPDAEAMPKLDEIRQRLAVYLRPGVSFNLLDADALHAELQTLGLAQKIETLAADTGIYALTPTGRHQNTLHKALNSLAAWCRDPRLVIADSELDHLQKREDRLQPAALARLRDGAEWAAVGQALAAYEQITSLPMAQYWAQLVHKVKSWRDQRLSMRNQLTFDTLITRVHDALAMDGALADRLFDKWPVALVDEFQDTDTQQYAILDRIYRARAQGSADAGAVRGRLVMIGDPKQAIYRFRGGDIDAYLRASEAATDRLTLDTNQRSSAALVQACNLLYSHFGPVLSSDKNHAIRYVDVRPSPRHKGSYRIDGQECTQPLVLHYKDDPADDKPQRREDALAACADQIAAMLSSGAHVIDGRRLRPGDIAVLLPTNGDVAALNARLVERRVPCVGGGRSNVFAQEWARELQLVLHAIRHPHSAPGLSAALATRLVGLDYDALLALRDRPEELLRHATHFEALRRRWDEAGVLAAIRDVVEDATPRLMRCVDGERALTDLRHLGELLQEAGQRLHGPDELLGWLAGQRQEADDGDAAEERQLRIESDARRVRLLTLHASKGLEFPIVILPLMWNHGQLSRDTLAVIGDQTGRRVVGFGHQAMQRYRQDGQDERFRVLYVALTRAVHACHVYVLPPGRTTQKNIAKPESDPERSALDASIEKLLASTSAGTALERADSPLLWSRDGWPRGHAAVRAEATPEPERHARAMPARTFAYERLHSFSSLSSGRASVFEHGPADDESLPSNVEIFPTDVAAFAAEPQAAREAPHPELLRLSTLMGAEFGLAVHAVFERRDPGRPLAQQLALIDRCLGEQGVRLGELPREQAVAAIARMIDASLEADLGDGLRLAALPAGAMRAELAFHYALDGASLRDLRALCARFGVIVPGSHNPALRGLMNGYIDLVLRHDGRFHVLDYKSNWLGDQLHNYSPAALDIEMGKAHYDLQALLYTIALERFLRQRLPDYRRDRHLGDAIYLFVRAAGLAPASGVWRRRFEDELISGVDALLSAGQSAHAGEPA